jgi:hypothetical protein
MAMGLLASCSPCHRCTGIWISARRNPHGRAYRRTSPGGPPTPLAERLRQGRLEDLPQVRPVQVGLVHRGKRPSPLRKRAIWLPCLHRCHPHQHAWQRRQAANHLQEQAVGRLMPWCAGGVKGVDATDDAGRREPRWQLPRADGGIRAPTGDAQDREPFQPKGVGHLADIVGPVDHRTSRWKSDRPMPGRSGAITRTPVCRAAWSPRRPSARELGQAWQ